MGNGSSRQNMRDRIVDATTDLLIRHGYRGASVSKIAKRVGSTTTNIFYHFGSKERLVEEVIADYVVKASAKQQEIWTDPNLPLRQKIDAVVAFNRERHSKFNSDGNHGNAWSLIGRMRLENDMLNENARGSLASFSRSLQEAIGIALRQAVSSGEIVEQTPIEDAVLMLTNIVNSSSVFSQDAGSFTRLEEFYAAFARFFFRSYGSDTAHGNGPQPDERRD